MAAATATGENKVGEAAPLLPASHVTGWDFRLFCLIFGIVHGTVTTTLAIASSILDPTAAGLGNGLLYCFYGTTALLLAVPTVETIGARASLIAAIWLMSSYVSAYLIATYAPATQLAAAATGGVLGGLATGTLWVAQGVYFADSARAHARRSGCSLTLATARLSGVFAIWLLGLEAALKLLSSLLLLSDPSDPTTRVSTSETSMMATFTALAILGAIASLFWIYDVPNLSLIHI